MAEEKIYTLDDFKSKIKTWREEKRTNPDIVKALGKYAIKVNNRPLTVHDISVYAKKNGWPMAPRNYPPGSRRRAMQKKAAEKTTIYRDIMDNIEDVITSNLSSQTKKLIIKELSSRL